MVLINAGDIVGGRYRVERLLGEGGMAAVWLAHDNTLRRQVAVKFLWERDPRYHKENVASFLREARLAASVLHHNVVQILDFGLHDEDTPYMVMEALKGKTLGERFDEGAQFTIREVLQLGGRSLEGLIAVHDAGIVHRDLKPENIFVIEERGGLFPKLLDFGISRCLDPSGGRRSAITTVAGRVIGTPEYMSPEQANGSADITRRSDVYAMGVILYETIAGDVPYRSEQLGELIVKITQGEAPSVEQLVPEIGKPISDVIERAMRLAPGDRYADAAEMFEAFQAAAEATLGAAGESAQSLPERAPGRRERVERLSGTTDALEFDSLPMARPNPSPRPTLDEFEDAMVSQAAPPGPGRGAVLPQWLWLSAAATLAAAALIAFGIARVSTSSEPPPRFIVVQGSSGEEGSTVVTGDSLADVAAASDGKSTKSTKPTEPTEPTEAGPDEPAAPVSAIEAPRVPARKRPASRSAPAAGRGEPEDMVARAFLRQKQGVVRCLERHADEHLPKLSVRLRLDVRGRVERADVLPSTVGRTTVGSCIEKAVSAMRFKPQRHAATYRVPLVARRGS